MQRRFGHAHPPASVRRRWYRPPRPVRPLPGDGKLLCSSTALDSGLLALCRFAIGGKLHCFPGCLHPTRTSSGDRLLFPPSSFSQGTLALDWCELLSGIWLMLSLASLKSCRIRADTWPSLLRQIFQSVFVHLQQIVAAQVH